MSAVIKLVYWCRSSCRRPAEYCREFEKARVVVSIASYAEKSEPEGAKKGPFCMGILATLGLSTEFEPRAEKNIFVDKVVSEYP